MIDPKKTAMVARAFRDAKIDAQEAPQVLAVIVVAFARELQNGNPRDGDTFVFMTIDQILAQWQPIRGEVEQSAVVHCKKCLEESRRTPADFWVIARTKGEAAIAYPAEDKIACCDPHAAATRDELNSLNLFDVKLERIRR